MIPTGPEESMDPSVKVFQAILYPGVPSYEESAKEFAAKLQTMRMEGEKAGNDGLAALERLIIQIIGHTDSQSLLIRGMLLSIFNGRVKVDLSLISSFDWELRKDLCTVLLGVGNGRFADFMIRQAFIEAGDEKAEWFLAGLPVEPSETE